MELDKPEYQGKLLLPPNGKILIKKSWHPKFCLLYKPSKFGIERLEVYEVGDTTRTTPARIITLENCIKISQVGATHFSLTTKTGTYEFETFTPAELVEWITAIQNVAFPDDTSRVCSIEEDNDLYCSSGEGLFSVKLHVSEASVRCNLEARNYTLVLTSSAIQLRNEGALLYTWPYCYIRRYGCRDGKFMFEAGRLCESGEGTFYWEHSNQKEIYRCLASKMNSMKKLLKGESTTALIDCGDNQFHAALSMEARSRSPLPPSPTTSTMLHDAPDSVQSLKSSIGQETTPDFHAAVRKPRPFKPPRKTLVGKCDTGGSSSSSSLDLLQKNKQTVESNVDSAHYDEVEYRSEAWKVLGTDEIKHTDNVVEENCEDYEIYSSWGSSKKEQQKKAASKAPKVLKQPTKNPSTDDCYDRLNFFGSSSKLNLPKAGYKQVSPAPVASNPPSVLSSQVSQQSFNDYDEIEPLVEGIRLADDSHLGYALIRKEVKVDHQFHNEEAYAVVSKPKRV